MAKRTERRFIRDNLSKAAASLDRAEGYLANVTSLYYERGAQQGALIEMMRATIQSQAQQVRDFRAQRS